MSKPSEPVPISCFIDPDDGDSRLLVDVIKASSAAWSSFDRHKSLLDREVATREAKNQLSRDACHT